MSKVIIKLNTDTNAYGGAYNVRLTLPDEVANAWTPYLADNGFKKVKTSGNRQRYQTNIPLESTTARQKRKVIETIYSVPWEISRQHPEVEFKYAIFLPDGKLLTLCPDDWRAQPKDDDFEWPDDWN